MDSKKTPLAVAIFIEVVYLFCALSVVFAPNFAKSFYGSWFHGLTFDPIWKPESVTFGSVLWGMVTSFIGAYIAAYIFVLIYKSINKK